MAKQLYPTVGKRVYLTLLCCLVAGCTAPNEPTPLVAAIRSAVPLQIGTHSPTPTTVVTTAPTATFRLLPTKVPTEVKPTATPEIGETGDCAGRQLEAVPKTLSGALVVQDQQNEQILLLRLPDKLLTPLTNSDERALQAVVSPTGHLISIQTTQAAGDAQTLKIIDKRGAIQFQTPWPEDRGSLVGWLDETHIVFHHYDDARVEGTLGYHYDVIDATTGVGTGEVFPPTDVYALPPFPNWNLWETYVPHQSGQFAAYLRIVDGVAWEYGLWSYSQDQVLASVRTFNNLVKPEWSPDNTKFAVAYSESYMGGSRVQDEIYAFELDGEVRQLTDLGGAYPTTFIQSLRWSPKGDRIAYWLNSGISESSFSDDYGRQTLMVLDVESHTSLMLCMEGDSHTNFRYKLVPAPYWSSDGKFVVIQNRQSDQDTRLFVVDSANGDAFEVGEQLTPLGWIQGP